LPNPQLPQWLNDPGTIPVLPEYILGIYSLKLGIKPEYPAMGATWKAGHTTTMN
jgi:hypothetical protein